MVIGITCLIFDAQKGYISHSFHCLCQRIWIFNLKEQIPLLQVSEISARLSTFFGGQLRESSWKDRRFFKNNNATQSEACPMQDAQNKTPFQQNPPSLCTWLRMAQNMFKDGRGLKKEFTPHKMLSAIRDIPNLYPQTLKLTSNFAHNQETFFFFLFQDWWHIYFAQVPSIFRYVQ